MNLKNLKLIFLSIFIFALTFIPRLYKLNNPVADWHSWRQADTAAIARNFAEHGINLLKPQADSFLFTNELQLDNPERLFMNELPYYNAVVALIYRAKGVVNPGYARLVSNFVYSLGAVFLFLLVTRLIDLQHGLVTAVYYALNPYSIYYGRVIMPDPIFVSLMVISLYWAVLWLKSNRWSHASLLAFTLALAMLAKPFAIFIGLPLVYWLYLYQQKAALKNKQVWFVAAVSLIPLAFWRLHVSRLPQGTFNMRWLFNETNIRFTGAFFRWLIFDRLNRLIFATGGFVLFIIGLLNSYTSKAKSLFFVWFLAIVAYMTIFAMGNVTHDYYQLPIVPVGAVLVSLGFWAVVKQAKNKFSRIFNPLLAVSLIIISFAFGWFEVRGFFNINHPEIVAAGQAADRLLPEEAIVIAPYNRDVAFLYQTNRYGWPIGTNIQNKIDQGATHYVTTTLDAEAQELMKICQTVDQTDQYLILDLQTCGFE